MKSWSLADLDLKPRLPEIISSSNAARAIALDLARGEALGDHEVHERTWLVVIRGEVEVSTSSGELGAGGPGLFVELNPGERHEVLARSDARLLLLLTPWPGGGHPGAMTITEKLYARRHAAKRTSTGAKPTSTTGAKPISTTGAKPTSTTGVKPTSSGA